MTRIELLDGKYAVVIAADQISYERRGEGWPGARGYTMEFNQLVEPLARRVALLEAALIHEYNEEWNVGDGITDEAKVQFLIDRIPK